MSYKDRTRFYYDREQDSYVCKTMCERCLQKTAIFISPTSTTDEHKIIGINIMKLVEDK